MIDLKALEREQPLENGKTYAELYRECLRNRKDDPTAVDRLLELNRERKRLISTAESKKAEQGKIGQTIALKKRNKENADAELQLSQSLAAEIKAMEVAASEADAKVFEFASRLPNMLHASVPVGASEEDNKVVRSFGEPKKFGFVPKEHFELGEKLGLLDFERAGKVTGARFAFLKGALASMERALLNFMLDTHTREHGYQEMLAPYIVNSASLFGTNQLPKFADDLFHLQGTDYHLIPTAEVPVTNYHRDEILDEDKLPIMFAAFSPCFRSEAGSHGRDTRGLIRQHQFQKVELMTFAHPEKSYEQHELLTSHAETILRKLELPFQTVALCSGDIGFGSAKTFDINVWLPGQKAYREISSCTNFEEFQARRANIRYRPKGAGSKPAFVHTLNGSGLAIGRTLVAICENYQQEDGSIQVPAVLQNYMGGLKVIS